MSTVLTIKELLERNKKFAADYKGLPYVSEFPNLNTVKVLVVTCADPRCVPEQFLGLQPMDCIIFRNMCGHVGPDLNGLLGLDFFINFEEIMIVHHTDCGASHFTDAQVAESIKARVPNATGVDSMDFGAITDIEQSVKDDLAVLKKSPLVRKELADRAQGFVYDIKTGLLSKVEE